MAHCPLLIADYLLTHSGSPLTPLQVIKLVYIAHGYSLALSGRPMVDEAVEAWRYGPVVPSVYHRAKKYGGGPITQLLYSGAGIGDPNANDSAFEHIPPRDRAVLDSVLEAYGKFAGPELISMTHGEGSPWLRYSRPRVADRQIPDNAIKEHYLEVIRDGSIRYR